MMKKHEQRGVALLFALGMLTLLLISGMAFVANALTAQKIAANNGARSQARVFAQSALSRVLASVMIYQYQLQKIQGEFPENFNEIYSYGTVNSNDTTNDKLSGEDSLLRLPNDNSIISSGIAAQFNNHLAQNSDAKWVYFYNTGDPDDQDRKIIGRAAWKVISSSPQISAPVFLSGMLPTDGTPGWYPSEHRWGREIDEVALDDNALFDKTLDVNWNNQFTMQDYNKIYSTLGFSSSDDAKKRFIDRWLMPDAQSDNFLSSPTAFVPEVYSYQTKEKGKLYQVMRFNISELEDVAKYSVPASADPWYARFGIDSNAAGSGINSGEFLDKLTAESPNAAINDNFDYELDKEDRPSLPFLRRIGNGKGTFDTLEALRKQIAANFNDYSDADNIPTSDISAEKWMDEMGTEYKHPAYTGNERTPYIYELGLRLGIFREANGEIDVSKTGVSVDQTPVEASNGKYSIPVNAYVNVAPLVKLANIYNFNPDDFSNYNFTAGVDLGAMEIKFKPSGTATIYVEYTHKPLLSNRVQEGSVTLNDVNIGLANGANFIANNTVGINELTGTVADGTFKTAVLNIDREALRNVNASGTAVEAGVYPLIVPDGLTNGSNAQDQCAKLNVNNIELTLSTNYFKARAALAGKILTGTVTIKKVALKSISAIDVTSVKFNLKRAYLAAASNGKNIGLDYVKALPEMSWTMTSGLAGALQGNTALEIAAQNGAALPGMFIGGIRNYDPRQNLNPDDWYKTITVAGSDDIRTPAKAGGLSDVMKLAGSANSAAGLRGAVNRANRNTEAEENNKFNPSYDVAERDREQTTGPGWSDNAEGGNDSKRLSTAFIRNAPMMSPWEIGLIHRGVMWQTINLKNACDPDNNSDNIQLTGHKPVAGWDKSGTRYNGINNNDYCGDAAILDQIKMTEKCVTYGKINVNRLRSNDELFNKEGANLEQYIAKALFEQIYHGERIAQFYLNSTRKNNGDFPGESSGSKTGTPINSFDKFDGSNGMSASREPHPSRAHFIAWSNGGVANAFGTFSPADTDAAREELVGKTANLLCAETSSPSQIKVVVVAQVIKDVAGTQFRKNASGTDVTKECDFAQFDYDSGNDIYFDEITGEVKMLVTIERDVTTGRMRIQRTDYLE